MDPVGLDELIPDWRQKGAPVGPTVTKDRFHILSRPRDFVLPNWMLPPLMQTHDGVITSLGDLVRWLGEQAQALGVDVFPMTAAVDVLTDAAGAVTGIITGRSRRSIVTASPSPALRAGIGIRAKYTLIGEGARGSLAKQLIQRFKLDAEGIARRNSDSASRRYGRSRTNCIEPGRVDHYPRFPAR